MPKKNKPELVKDEENEAGAAQEGHNSGQFNEALAALFQEFEELDENKRQIAKAQRDLRAKAKEQFGVQANVFSHEIRCRKMDKDVRIQFEQGHTDLKDMLGYQFALGIAEDEAPEGDDPNPEEAAERLSKR